MHRLRITLVAALAAAALLVPALARTASAGDAHGFNRADMDTTCAPCKDFYQYVNGNWVASHEIPPSYPGLGTGQEVGDRNRDVLHALLEDAVAKVKTAKPGSNDWKLGVYYGACMDSVKAEAEGYNPIKPTLDGIAAIKDVPGLLAQVARMHGITSEGGRGGPSGVMFRAGPTPDIKNSDMVIASVGQGGITLPDRDYYLKDDPRSKMILDAYTGHIARTLQLIGESEDQARADAAKVVAIETQLAKNSITNVERRDPLKSYHKMTVAELQALAPAIDWKAYFKAAGFPEFADVNVAHPAFFKALNGMIASVPIEDWKAYLRFHVTNSAAPTLSSAFVNEEFSFSKYLSGSRELQPRWKRCITATDFALGEALGEKFVQTQFPPAAKARAQEMVGNLVSALHERLQSLEWMSPETRAAATAKLDAFQKKIGYPDHFRDYSKLELKEGDYFGNRVAVARFERARQLAKVGKPLDRSEWTMTPPTVNAYYNPSFNEIVFPAGILQPPYYDPNADDAYNYGSIGAVIGHEMTHGFDDQGRQFDPKGNLRDWWTADDAAKFKVRADRVAHQFDGYVALDTMHVNGRLTLGENIADLGGLAIAYRAYEKSLEGKERKVIDGFTPEQRFFIGFARQWRSKQRPEMLRNRVLTDPHSPNFWRVDGPISNLPEFAKAFGCKQGDAMVRPDSLQARIW